MDTSRVGPGEWLAALGGLVLLIALFFLDWYSWEPSGDIAPLEISSSLFAQVDPNQLQIPVPDVSVDLSAWDEQGTTVGCRIWGLAMEGVQVDTKWFATREGREMLFNFLYQSQAW